MSSRRLKAIILKEIKEIARDKLYLAMAFGVPIILKILFGYGLTLDVKNIPLAVLDQNRSILSREYIHRVTQSHYFTLHDYLTDYSQLENKLMNGRIRLGLIIPPNFDRTIHTGRPAEMQVLIDGSFPDRAATIRSYLEVINMEYNRYLLEQEPTFLRRAIPWIEVESRAWFNSDLESKNFIVPGLIATTLFYYPALLASIAVVREKETGSIYNIYCSPIRREEYILGKLLPYWGIGFINYLLLALLTNYLFQVELRGSSVFLTIAALIYVGVSTSMGLLMSILFKTQVSAMLITTVITLIPSFIYSGFFISVPSMGPEARFMAYILPPTYFMEIVRGVYLKGLGFSLYWRNLLILTLFLLTFIGLAIKKLAKKLQ